MLDLIPTRWLDYEPQCHIAEAGLIGAVASVAGTGLSAISSINQASYQSAVARNEALQAQQKANEDAAIGERAAITEQRKTDLALSRARAVGAAGGTDAASPSQVTLEGQIAQQGGYNAMSALYEGLSKSAADTAQADIDLFKAKQASAAAPLNALALLTEGLGKTASVALNRRSLLNLYGD